MLYDLEMTGWLDHRTRAVMAELTVYNPPLNRFALVQVCLCARVCLCACAPVCLCGGGYGGANRL